MKGIIQFQITKGDDGYVAEGTNVPIVTQAETLDDLSRNIREAVELHFEGENPRELGFADDPSVLVNYELPVLAHA